MAFVVLCPLFVQPAQAHISDGKIRGSCTMTDQGGRGTVTVTIANVWDQAVLNVTPGDLFGSRTGTAELFVQTFPRPVRSLLPGKDTAFQWRGRLYGDGLLDLSVEVTAAFDGGGSESTGIINCNRIAVGVGGPTPADTPGSSEPTATRTAVGPTATRTAAEAVPTNTVRPTRTSPVSRPTRTPRLDPTATATPLRPTATATVPRPTATATRPRQTSTPTRVPPTRTPIQDRATRTPIVYPTRTPTRTEPIRPTATSTRPQPTATDVPPRATRTPAAPATARPTRTPNNLPPTVTPTLGTGPLGALNANCSLRRNIDLVTVTMVVQNQSGVEVRGLSASSLNLEPEGGALFFDRTGPSPNAVATLRAGMSASFQWTGRLSPGGTMGFSATAGGTTPSGPVQTRLIDCGVTGTGSGGFDPSTFSGTCTIHPGDPGTMTVELRNGTAEPLTKIEAFFSGKTTTGTATLTEIRGPAPRMVSALSTGLRREFQFAARFLGSGDVTLRFEGKGNRSTYDRISTGDITCTAQTGPTGGNLPDLGVDEAELHNTWHITTENFAADHCAVVEGCVDGTGQRKLLRFNTTTPNYGPGDVFLGDPRGSSTFQYSSCHNHYHFKEYADYRLLDMGGNIVARGHKQAFCLVDLYRPPGLRGDPTAQFTDCGFQGISAGWADVYHGGLDCQWIDVTGVPPGRYMLEVQINPAHVIQEHDYSNNVGRTEITIQ
ncbi:MAG: lysyl oxidase family protein [bacterium]